MVDSALLERVKQLDKPALHELRGIIDQMLTHEQPSAAMLAIVDARLAKKRSRPDPDAITLDEFERRLAKRTVS